MERTPSVLNALSVALKAAGLGEQDKGAVALAKRYAAHLDTEDADLVKVGPLLLSALTALGLTPAARAAVTKGGEQDDQPDSVDELRQRRRARKHNPAAVDPAAP